jgi:hypothetical protein
MAKKPGLKAVSTALATMAIILVLILGMSWMAYMVVLNARQQAEMAGRAETVALKAKELIRVYVWLDPARQPDGRHLNLTRISFVGEWSGETVINGLLIAYTDGRTEVRNVNIRLGAGEDKTYLPSELGLTGLDNYNAFKARVKYIQAHTSLGNDFVNVWGRPDKPALYVTGTTRTDTYTTTRTETSRIPTTTTTSVTRTSYTTTVTTTQTMTWTPPPGLPYGKVWCGDAPDLFLRAYVEFNANGWGTPPYQIRVYATYYDWTWKVIGTYEVAVLTVSGTSYSTNFIIEHPWGEGGIIMSMRAIDLNGLYAEWGGGGCYIAPPPPPGTTSSTSFTSFTTSTGTPTTTTGNTIVTVTETITSTSYVGGAGWVTTTAYVTRTSWFVVTETVYWTFTSVIESLVTTTVMHGIPYWVTETEFRNRWQPVQIGAGSGICPAGDILLVQKPTDEQVQGLVGWRQPVEAGIIALLLYTGRAGSGRRRVPFMLAASILLLAMTGLQQGLWQVYGQLYTTTVYVTTWITVTLSGQPSTVTVTQTNWVTETTTWTMTTVVSTVTETRITTWTFYSSFYVTTVTTTSAACDCTPPAVPFCAYSC